MPLPHLQQKRPQLATKAPLPPARHYYQRAVTPATNTLTVWTTRIAPLLASAGGAFSFWGAATEHCSMGGK
jgi:hypothetical protein